MPASARGLHDQDPEAVIQAARHWALGIGSEAERPATAKLVLPALRPLPAYAPASSIALPHLHDAASDDRVRSAKVSQLGEHFIRTHDSTPLAAPADLVDAVAAAKSAAATARPSPPCVGLRRFRALQGEPWSPIISSRSDGTEAWEKPRRKESLQAPKILRTKTVLRPDDGRPVVRGQDPMGGGLFGRDAALDETTKRRGIYDSQLVKRGVPSGRK